MHTLMIDFIAFSNMWARQLWPVIYQSALLAGVIFMITRHKKISANLRFGLWMLVPLRMLVMPIATVSLPVLPVDDIAGSVHIEWQNIETGVKKIPRGTKPLNANFAEIPDPMPQAAVSDSDKVETVRESIDLQSGIFAGLFFLWVLGVTVFSLRAIAGWYRINGIIRNGKKVKD